MTTHHHAQSLAALHAAFLVIVPRIERHGRVYFRGLKDPDKLEEVIQEAAEEDGGRGTAVA